jgi:hypothetical protein
VKGKRADTFVKVLNQAADRLYLRPVWLVDDLDRDPIGTLHTLSSTPEAFGEIKPCHDAQARQVRLQDLLTAARAYINAGRKYQTGSSS